MSVERHGQLHPRDAAGPKVEITGARIERAGEVLTPLALQLLAIGHREARLDLDLARLLVPGAFGEQRFLHAR